MSRYPLLEKISSPNDLKNISEKALPALMEEMRRFLIDKVSVNGGHLASNLGVVELTVALHRVFDSPNDRIIFDVGHQSYVHKIITGRMQDFETLRTPGGLSGFPRREESVHDAFGTGHSSTSLSAALGFARASALRKDGHYTVCVVGDGAFTGGMIHEALNNCDKNLRLLIVLNENEMSISKNIGLFAKYFTRIRASRRYFSTKKKTKSLLSHLPLGKQLTRAISAVKDWIKKRIYRNNYFEELGLSYFGPVYGHDEEMVEKALVAAKNRGGAAIIHLHTQKGKGYAKAEEDPTAFHGLVPDPSDKTEQPRTTFHAVAAETLLMLAERDPSVCAVTAAMGEGTGLTAFGEKYPERYFDVGIAEEHALTFCAGLAAADMKPYFAVYSTFLQRAYDNLLHDVALQKLPVRILVDRTGLSEKDGATHHGIFDVAFASHIPGVEIFAPATYGSLCAVLLATKDKNAPILIRYPNRSEDERIASLFYPSGDYDSFGVRALGTKDPGAVLIAYGDAVSAALDAVCLLGNAGVKTELLLLETLAPYDQTAKKVLPYLTGDCPVFFVEEGIRDGGAGMLLGHRLREAFAAENRLLSYTVLGIDGHFASPDHPVSLKSYAGVDGVSIAKAVASGV